MPSKKPTKQEVKQELKGLIEQYGIKFEGPVPPHKWPRKQKHLFQVIRDIWANRYDEYKKRTGGDETILLNHLKRVRNLRNNAYRLRAGININEGTWRGVVETLVFGRFDEEIVCSRCGNENWKSDYEAQPFDDDEKAKLERNRRKRRLCTCYNGSKPLRNLDEDSDEENQTLIFSKEIGALVSHVPEDGLEASGIPMRPDRVVGFHINNRYREYIASYPTVLTHCPVETMELIYPFLVIEAKKESDAPGFRSVEAQTAFSIRRLLKIQDDLRTTGQNNHDPLVWFFGFQGEVWRLYAGTLDGEKVQVFDLWLGSIESQDGALQILQIVDFIWTWARDIYRPQIRRCLRNVSDLREISPTSTNPFPRSESVFSTSSVRSFSQTLLESVREEDTIAQAVEGYDHLGFQDASSHPFLRWADHSHVSTPEAFQSSIRHSDIVTFSFRVLWLPDNEESFPSLLFSPQNEVNSLLRVIPVLKKAHQHRQTLLLSIDQISEIERYWTGENTQPSSGLTITKPTQIVSAFLFFRTYCRPEDWQVIREVYCIIWSSQAAKFLKGRLNTNLDPRFESGRVQHSDIIGAFQQLRNLSGRHSVAYALQNISLILSPRSDISSTGRRLEWRQPQDQGVSEPVIAQYFALFNSISKSGDRVRSSHHHSHRLLRVTRTEQASDTPADLPHVPENVGQGGAMLALKPSLWPSQCPRFCLFILLDQDFDDKARLAGLLRYTIESREMYGELEKTAQGQLSLSASDIHILGSWLDSFGPG